MSCLLNNPKSIQIKMIFAVAITIIDLMALLDGNKTKLDNIEVNQLNWLELNNAVFVELLSWIELVSSFFFFCLLLWSCFNKLYCIKHYTVEIKVTVARCRCQLCRQSIMTNIKIKWDLINLIIFVVVRSINFYYYLIPDMCCWYITYTHI